MSLLSPTRCESGKYYYMMNSIAAFIIKDPMTLMSMMVVMLFITVSSRLHFEFQKSITEVEQFIIGKISDDSNRIFISFLILPVSHYLTSLIHKLTSAYVLQLLMGRTFRQCLKEYISMNHNEFHRLGSGQIHSLVERRANAMIGFMRTLFTGVIFNILFVLWGFLYFYHCSVGIVLLTIIQIIIYIVVSWCGTRIRSDFRKKYNSGYNSASNRLYWMLQNYDIIKCYNKEEDELSRYYNGLNKVGIHSREYDQVNGFIEFFQKSLFFLPNAFLVFVVMNGYMFQRMRVGNTYIEYSKFFSELRNGVMKLKDDIFMMNENLTDIFDSRISEIKEESDTGLPLDSFHDVIRFIGVSIYIGEKQIIKDFTGEIRRGERIGIIGKNGCGKSSFINVLLRFLDYSGSILVDGIELREIRKSSMRDLISFVPQNHYLFNGTILENITYSCDSVDYDHVVKRCEYFNTHRTFKNLENGYSTCVGEGGKFLSGGQKQKVGFMRAMIKDSDVVLLDEPTSNLDSDSGKELVDMIFKRMTNKTVVLVIHNHDSLKGFDKILGIHDGTITIYNSFDDFISNRSKY